VNPPFPKKLPATQTLKAISMEVKVGRRLKDKAVKDIKSKSFPAGALKIAAEPAVPLTLEELISEVVKAREERGG
jgi:hypothetical protein